jgi:hypothetical protein
MLETEYKINLNSRTKTKMVRILTLENYKSQRDL